MILTDLAKCPLTPNTARAQQRQAEQRLQYVHHGQVDAEVDRAAALRLFSLSKKILF